MLFADLVGFTPFSEEQDAEEVREFLSRYFDIAREIVGRYGGTVEKFIGDAVMAVWGAPRAHEDDAERAVRAALEIVDTVRGLAPGIDARAGVLTGEAAVTLGAGNQGMVAGDLVNTSSRLQTVAPPGTVLVGEATMRAASGAIVFEPVGEQILKGKSAPVPAWRALRVVAYRGGAGRAEALEAPFVGRDEEFRLFKELLHTTGRDPRSRLLSVTGPAGIGKSRMAWELEKYIDGVLETIYWHRGRSPAYGEGVTFWALGEMVRHRARLAETDGETATRTRIEETVAEYVPDPEDRKWIEPALLALLGLEPPPPGGRDALFSAWRMFFEWIARRGTVVLVFEDLQWADSGLLDFIDHVMEWSKGAPIFVVTLARPELFDRRGNWGAGKKNFTSMALEPLTNSAMRELLAGLVPGLPEHMVEAIVERADGVPLYAVETVRMLVGDGRLRLMDGYYQPVGDLGDLAVPDSLRSLISSRLDGLDPADRSLLQDAAVLGQSFTPSALEAVSGLSSDELASRLAGLVRRELLQVEMDPRSPERGQYAFVQALIREVAYGTLAKADRRRRHVAAAQFFESLGDEELAGAVATQYLDAYRLMPAGPDADQVAGRARSALAAAAERASSLGAHEQAVAFLELALSVTTAPAAQAELLERAATSCNSAGQYSAAESFARRALEILRPTGDPVGIARVTFSLGRALINEGRAGEAIVAFEDALAERPFEGSEALDEAQARLLAGLAHAYQRHGDYDRAYSAADRAIAAAERLDLTAIVAEAMVTKGSGLFQLGRRREGIALLEGAIPLAAQTGQIFLELRARNNVASALSDHDPRQGWEVLKTGLALAEKVGDRQMTRWMAGFWSVFAHVTGQAWDEALQLLRDHLDRDPEILDRITMTQLSLAIRGERGEPVGDQIDELMGTGHMTDSQLRGANRLARSQVAFAQGDFEMSFRAALEAFDSDPNFAWIASFTAGVAALWAGEAQQVQVAADRLEAASRTGNLYRAAQVGLRAGLAAFEGRHAEAVNGFRESVHRFSEAGADFYVAQAGLVFARALGPTDPEARAAAAEAREIFARLGAAPWLEKVDAVMSGRILPILAPSTVGQEAPIV